MEDQTIHYYSGSEDSYQTQKPPMNLEELFAKKTHERMNSLVVSNNTNPLLVENSGADMLPNNTTKFAQEFSNSSFNKQASRGLDPFHWNTKSQWTKVRKGEKDTFKEFFVNTARFFSSFSLKKIVPAAIIASVLIGGITIIRSVSDPDSISEARGVESEVEDSIRQDEREKVLQEQKDEQITNSMTFLKQARNRFESVPSGDVKLIDSANDLSVTRQTLQNNLNLYTTIYLHEELAIYHLDELRDAEVGDNDLRATLYSIFELEKRAYDRAIDIRALLDELDTLYDSDRNRKLEVRAVANESIVQLNQTHAEMLILVSRLDRFFVD